MNLTKCFQVTSMNRLTCWSVLVEKICKLVVVPCNSVLVAVSSAAFPFNVDLTPTWMVLCWWPCVHRKTPARQVGFAICPKIKVDGSICIVGYCSQLLLSGSPAAMAGRDDLR
eukprot:GHVT01088011.1.p1 GENE.GHVT01088011.1~~GHVT01088011.1.p1  ORF type:complete len:113 (+),score=8.12 GHVT01088011.1:297-635(+)